MVCESTRVDKPSSDTDISQGLVVFVIHSVLLIRLSDQIQFKMAPDYKMRQQVELLLLVPTTSHLEQRRLVVKLALRKANLDLDLPWRVVVAHTLDSLWIKHSQCE